MKTTHDSLPDANTVWENRNQPQPGDCDLRYGGRVHDHRVLVFVDSSFFDVFRNWMVFYVETCGATPDSLRALELVCMDDGVSALLARMSLRCSERYSSVVYQHGAAKVQHKRSKVWMKRLEIITQLLARGTDLVLSDSDAFWLRSPYAELGRRAEGGADIVASRGWFPFHLSRRWGSALCMGFMLVKAGERSVRFFEGVLRDMAAKDVELQAYQHFLATNETRFTHADSGQTVQFDLARWQAQENHEPDDQFSANQLLFDWNVSWPAGMARTYREEAHTGVVRGNATATTPATALVVTLLPENAYLRNCADTDIALFDRVLHPLIRDYRHLADRVLPATIAHCVVAPGDSRKKEKLLTAFSLWRLPYNASEVGKFLRHAEKVASAQMHRLANSNSTRSASQLAL